MRTLRKFNGGILRTMVFLFMLAVIFSFAPTSKAFASAPSLDDITSNKQVLDEKTKADEEDREFIEGITAGMDMTGAQDEFTKQAGGMIQKIATIIVQLASYVITAGLCVRVACDLAYIIIPPLRVFLANGYVGNPNVTGDMNNMQGGAIGTPGMVGGGMGIGMHGGMAGMHGGMVGGAMQGNQMAMQNQPARGRIQWVSNAALNAVATESTVGPDGKANGPFKTYIKDMVVVLVLTPVLLVLAFTGVLADLGFVIGMGLETIIRAWTAKF